MLDSYEKNISLRELNNNKKKIRLVDIDNNKKIIRLANIDKQKPATPNWTFQKRLLSELSSTFKEVTFSKSEFPASTFVLDTKYKYLESQNNNLFYFFNN